MKTGSLVARQLAVAILIFAFVVSVYRAKTQSIAHDEALTYEWFLDGGVYHLLAYNPANHVLLTLLAKPVVWVWGVTEFKLRLPGLLGTALYLIFSYLLSRRLFGDGISMCVSVALLGLNPEVMDLMAAARGYLLGLACLGAAMYLFARLAERGLFNPDDKDWRWTCFMASLFLGISVVANFTNVVPAVCMAFSFSIEAMGGLRALGNLKGSRLQTFATYFLLPGATAGFCLLWPYLIQVRRTTFKVSLSQASIALQDVFAGSFLHKWTDDNAIWFPGAMSPAAGSWQQRTTVLGGFVLLPALLGLVAAGLILAWRASRATRGPQSAYCRMFGLAALASVASIIFLHIALRVDYPVSRYCIFLVPLFTVGSLLACREIDAFHPKGYLKAIGLLIATGVLFDYALSLQVTAFRYTTYDVISRDLYRAIEKDARVQGLNEVRVGGTWWYEPEINFYRRLYHATWMHEYEVRDKSYFWQFPSSLTPKDYDYFVFVPDSDPGLTGPQIRTIYHDAKTQATIIAIAHMR